MDDPELRAICGLLVAIAVRINSVANVLHKSSESTESSSTELRSDIRLFLTVSRRVECNL